MKKSRLTQILWTVQSICYKNLGTFSASVKNFDNLHQDKFSFG